MDADTLIEKIKLVVQDESFDDDTILDYINKGMREIAGLVDLPLLRTSDTVDTSTSVNYVAMPDDYQKKCFVVVDVANEVRLDWPGQLYQYHKFLVRNPVPSAGSSVSDVAIRGKTLFYDPICDSAQTLRVEYFRYPTALVYGEEPDEFPSHLHESLLVPAAARELFNLIEDGIEGQKVNTNTQNGFFRDAIAELRLFVGDTDSEPVFIADDY